MCLSRRKCAPLSFLSQYYIWTTQFCGYCCSQQLKSQRIKSCKVPGTSTYSKDLRRRNVFQCKCSWITDHLFKHVADMFFIFFLLLLKQTNIATFLNTVLKTKQFLWSSNWIREIGFKWTGKSFWRSMGALYSLSTFQPGMYLLYQCFWTSSNPVVLGLQIPEAFTTSYASKGFWELQYKATWVSRSWEPLYNYRSLVSL